MKKLKELTRLSMTHEFEKSDYLYLPMSKDGLKTHTFTTGKSWNDDPPFNMDELLELVKIIKREKEEYKLKVKKFCRKLRPCPLIIKMYGSMEGLFGIQQPDIYRIICQNPIKINNISGI